jgi:hypothetical protein
MDTQDNIGRDSHRSKTVAEDGLRPDSGRGLVRYGVSDVLDFVYTSSNESILGVPPNLGYAACLAIHHV